MILSGDVYKKYLAKNIAPPLYTSKYVKMEFRRGFINTCLDFYFLLSMPHIRDFDAAASVFSEKFSIRGLKDIVLFFGKVFTTRRIDYSGSRGKEALLRHFADIVDRIEILIRKKYVDIGKDSARCPRAIIEIENSQGVDRKSSYSKFQKKFNDKKNCAKACELEKFLFQTFQEEVQHYIEAKEEGPINKDPSSKGFLKLAETLKDMFERGSQSCTCDKCSKIGDVIIALDAPRDMMLHTTDRAFDYLCPPIKQPHKIHPSQTAVLKSEISGAD